jgi:hypothetical protein
MKEMQTAYKILIGSPERNKPLRRPRRRREDNIKMKMREIGFWVWIGLIFLGIGTAAGLLWTR